MTRVTKHASERGRERLGLKDAAVNKLAGRALERGKAPTDFSGSFRRYLDGKARQHNRRLRIYGESIWVFSADVEPHVVTVLDVPQKFRALLRRLRARQRES